MTIMVSCKDAAERLGVPLFVLSKVIKDGMLTAVRGGQTKLVDLREARDAVEAYEQNKPCAAARKPRRIPTWDDIVEQSDTGSAAIATSHDGQIARLAKLVKPNDDIHDVDFMRSYINRYLPALVAAYVSRCSPDELGRIVSECLSEVRFRALFASAIESLLGPEMDEWWQLRVCMICLKEVDR